MISTIRNFFFYYFLPTPEKLGKKTLKGQSKNLAEKISLLFNPAKTPPPLPDLQGLQSASVGAKLGAVAHLGLGTFPTLAIDTSCVVSGMYLRKQKPVLGYGLIGYGLTDNLFQTIHPFTGLFSDNGSSSATSQLLNGAIGLPGTIASICTSTLFAAIVPVAGFISYKHSQSLAMNSISDLAAIKHWITKAQTDPSKLAQLQELWNTYSQKHTTANSTKLCEKLSQRGDSFTSALESKEVLDVIRFLLDNVPKDAIRQAKEEIFASQRKKLPDDPIQTGLATAAIAGGIALIVARILGMLTERSIAAVNVIITALTVVSIIGLVASVLTSAYQTYQDVCAPNGLVPHEAKMFSVAKLVSNIATAALLTVSIFTPGVNIFLMITLTLGTILSMYASYKRSAIIQQRVSVDQASRPETAFLAKV